jgi:MacB-like periplasmic core domain
MIHYLRALAARLRGLFGDRKAEQGLDDEIEMHLRLLTERYVHQGMSETEAAWTARRQFGNVTLLREVNREMRGIRFIEALFQDVRYGLQILKRNPGFTLIATLTLGLGIGANTAIFSVVNALMLRPLPFPDPERLVWVEVNSGTNTGGKVEGGLFFDWQEQSRTLEGMAALNSSKTEIYQDRGRAYTRRFIGGGDLDMVEVGAITANFFTVLGVQPFPPGRNFIAAEDRRGSDRVAILSYELWQRHYNGDTEIVGKTIKLDAVKTKSFGDFIVVGVAPANFHYFYPYDVWVPMGLDPQRERAIDAGERTRLPVVARLKPGVTLEQSRVEFGYDSAALRNDQAGREAASRSPYAACTIAGVLLRRYVAPAVGAAGRCWIDTVDRLRERGQFVVGAHVDAAERTGGSLSVGRRPVTSDASDADRMPAAGYCGRRIRITARFLSYKTACACLSCHPRRDESDGGNYD